MASRNTPQGPRVVEFIQDETDEEIDGEIDEDEEWEVEVTEVDYETDDDYELDEDEELDEEPSDRNLEHDDDQPDEDDPFAMDEAVQRAADAMASLRYGRFPNLLFGINSTLDLRPSPSTLPVNEEPNENGRALMVTSDFGSTNPGAKKISREYQLLKRELGYYCASRGVMRACNQRLAQSCLPESKADFIIDHDYRCYIGQFSEDGDLFYSCAQDMKVRMFDTYDPHNWKHYKTVDFMDGQWTITDASLSPDNKFLAYSSITSVVCLADTTPGRDETMSLEFARGNVPHSMHPSAGIMSVKFSGDGNEICVGAQDQCVYIYDITANKPILKMRGHTDDVNAVCYADKSSPHIIYSGSDDTTIKIWDRRSISDGRPVGVFAGHTEGITFVHSKGDGRYVVSNGKDQQMKLWDLRNMMDPDDFQRMGRKNYSTRFDYRTDWYPIFNPPRRHPYDKSIVSIQGHSVHRTLIRCYFSPPVSSGSRYIYSGSADGKVKIYNIDSTLAKEINVHDATSIMRPIEDPYPRRPYSWWGGFHRDYTCVRDVSWHPTAPVFAATSFQAGGGRKGSISVHTWRGADWDLRDDDKKKGYTPKIFSSEMEELSEPRPYDSDQVGYFD